MTTVRASRAVDRLDLERAFDLSVPNDINGRTINGMQLGLMHRF
jgi:hypothetical protein